MVSSDTESIIEERRETQSTYEIIDVYSIFWLEPRPQTEYITSFSVNPGDWVEETRDWVPEMDVVDNTKPIVWLYYTIFLDSKIGLIPNSYHLWV